MAATTTVNLEMNFPEEDLAVARSSASDTQFDVAIGHIEDIIMEEEFQTMQYEFMESHYLEFEDTEENKFIYTDIHKEYTDLVEKHIQHGISNRMPTFSMQEFQEQIIGRKDELEGEVFEMLLTFSDFMAFKEMMLDYRNDKEGRTVDLSLGLTVTSLGISTPGVCCSAMRLGEEDMMEGGNTPRMDCGDPVLEATPLQINSCMPDAPIVTTNGQPHLRAQDESAEPMVESPRLDQ